MSLDDGFPAATTTVLAGSIPIYDLHSAPRQPKSSLVQLRVERSKGLEGEIWWRVRLFVQLCGDAIRVAIRGLHIAEV